MRGASRRLAAGLALLAALGAPAAQEPLRVGSKRFTESFILGEVLVETARRGGAAAEHRPGLGNTAILVEALKGGAIDAYPEYTGTIAAEILKAEGPLDLAALNARLSPLGLAARVPLGFSNSYAIGLREEDAARLGIARVSDLARTPELKLGLSHEFLGRRDGWPGLKAAYGLPQAPIGLDHGLAYEALAAGQVQAIDLYTTDAKLAGGKVRVLDDDRRYFPRYDAVILHRLDAPVKHPAAFAALAKLEGRIDERTMQRLNARAEIDRVPFAEVAREYLSSKKAADPVSLWGAIFAEDFARLTLQHLGLVLGSLLAATLVGIPLGILAAKVPAVAQAVLAITGVAQTIPSLALLAILIPLTGMIGTVPALIALFVYALLPIVRNTHAGLLGISRGQRDAARALGLREATILAKVELPLAAPTILAGVKTAAVIGVGTATIAAFVGAGGYGERIVQGLALSDNRALLAGAIPAAALALVVHGLFEFIEHRMGHRSWN
ncbi:ABC transporter permease [Betaproteobacteria bacterium GR16-43]|nr:ABC transporter permease [Betaproteobacteria bacterium GR16-43]